MSTFELAPSRGGPSLPEPSAREGLGSVVLLHNARWFTKVRWIVVSVFIVTGAVGNFLPGTMRALGLIPPTRWPWLLAGVIALSNSIFLILVRRLKENCPRPVVETNIWLQIVVDMLIVTVLVHIVGSTDTFVSFTYLFHIVLACIFFPPRHSLEVTLLAAGLYLLAVVLELSGIWPASSILISSPRAYLQDNTISMVFAVSAVTVWFGVWSLVSTLSEAVRKRDQQLNAVNEQLIRAEQEKTREVLRTTHDLKAPFSGIDSNIQVLKLQHWTEIPESVRAIIDRIEVRALTLSQRIEQILMLGDLKSRTRRESSVVPVDLQAVINAVVEDLGEKANERRVALHIDVSPRTVLGDVKQFTVLFSNLLANAILYSYEGGRVEVSSREDIDGVHLSVSDHGIGIRSDALPHIFDEYFRTNGAARFNRMSTGLGLAIVREIAKNLELKIKVISEEGKGTTFEVTIPKKRESKTEEDVSC